VLEQAKREIEESGKLSAGSVSALRAEFTAMRTAAADIQQKFPTHNPAMWEEVECWVEAFDGLGATGLAAVDYWTAPSADVVNRLLAGFAAMEDAGERHRQKGLPDRWARAAVSGGTVVLPFLEWTLDQAAVKLAGGQEVAAAEPAYRAFSNIPALNELGATRDGIYVRLNPVREVIPVAPGQWIALALPPGVPANYVHLRLGDEKASERGEVQLSVDGESWQRQATRNQGAEMQSGLDPARGFRFMRYINTSGQPVEVQFDLFKLDVPEDSRANLPAAMSDGQLSSYYTVPAGERVDPPQPGATQVTVLSPDPEALEEVRDRDGLHLRATREVRVHEILWR
jgi:hyaluronoglucosaminidase